jgi:hypothetical protein
VDTDILKYVFRIWVCEIAVSAFNYFVLMQRVYQPRWGELRAHRIGMTTRIVYIVGFAYVLDHSAHLDQVGDYLLAGAYWTLMVLAFEWVGSLLIRRPVKEILVGWHVERGYMWPYVLLTYLFSPLVVGVLFAPGTN